MDQNKIITFVMFNINDGTKDEQKRISLSVESLLKQNKQNHLIIFIDCSQKEKQFKLPVSNILKVISMPTEESKFSPAYLRNYGATITKTKYICHTNSDIVFDPKFTEILGNNLNADKLIMCERKNTSREQSDGIKTLKDAYEIAKNIKKTAGDQAVGDCQALECKKFIKYGGFYNLIKDGKAEPGSYAHQSYREDSFLLKNLNKFKVKKHYIHKYTWILHLAHPFSRKIKAERHGKKVSN